MIKKNNPLRKCNILKSVRTHNRASKCVKVVLTGLKRNTDETTIIFGDLNAPTQ